MKKNIYLTTYAALMVLLSATLGLALIDLGRLSLIIAMTIAFAKMGLVAMNFMHLSASRRVNVLFALAGLYWLGILVALTLSDYLTRAWH